MVLFIISVSLLIHIHCISLQLCVLLFLCECLTFHTYVVREDSQVWSDGQMGCAGEVSQQQSQKKVEVTHLFCFSTYSTYTYVQQIVTEKL
jgi:hypothetical protein